MTVDYARVEEWVDRARGNDPAAFRELFRLFLPAARKVARGFAELDEAEVEDVVQDAFARCFRSLPSLRASRLFPAWLLASTRNGALKQLERRRGQNTLQASLAAAPPEVLEGIVSASASLERDAAIVRELIDELPEGPEKATVRLFYVEGEFSAREIAEKLGVGKSTVTMRLDRFRARIKRELLARVLRARLE